MPVSNPLQTDWSNPGAIGANIPNTAQVSLLTVQSPSVSRVATFSSNQPSTRIAIDNPSNSGFSHAHNGISRWSVASYFPSGSRFSWTVYNDQVGFPSFFIHGDSNFVGIGTDSPGARLDVNGNLLVRGTIRPNSYTVATVPSASANTGAMIYVSNESAGATIAFSDGTNWRRVHDRSIIS